MKLHSVQIDSHEKSSREQHLNFTREITYDKDVVLTHRVDVRIPDVLEVIGADVEDVHHGAARRDEPGPSP